MRALSQHVRAIIRRRWRPADMPACRQQMAAAAAALEADAPGVQGTDALALREQLRLDAARQRQGELGLSTSPSVTQPAFTIRSTVTPVPLAGHLLPALVASRWADVWLRG